MIEYCCDGYAEIITDNETTCVPTCRGGCIQGFCSAPNFCTCNLGFEGRHCSQRKNFLLFYFYFLFDTFLLCDARLSSNNVW